MILWNFKYSCILKEIMFHKTTISMKILATMITLLMITTALSPLSQIEIQGIVYDESGRGIPGVSVIEKGTTNGINTDIDGKYSITVPNQQAVLVFSFIGYQTQEIQVASKTNIDVNMIADNEQLEEVVVVGYATKQRKSLTGSISGVVVDKSRRSKKVKYAPMVANDQIYERQPIVRPDTNSEDYADITENTFRTVNDKPLSTFSIDVDAASYSNMRRFITNNQTPPKDAVRIEEMINYFNYDYEAPKGDDPFSINTEISKAPWNTKHQLVHVGLQGKKVATEDLPASNLVFLIDVSGSMSSSNKLPLLKAGYKLLVQQLRPEDRVAIVVYAGAAGEVLPSTPGDQKEKIIDALDKLQAGGSTAGGAGINLAYKIAQQNFKKDGNNRIILATDGDFNVGASSNESMEDLIEKKREEGVFLTVLGLGMGNYQDSKMEILADKGNGNYAYIDNILEAKKVLVNEFGGTLFTIAKDVKIQIEFNPAIVQAYRLIGYENRALKDEDFNNDKKDAGELGSGHTVTALYEVIPVGVKSEFTDIDPLKYQKNPQKIVVASNNSDEIMNVKLRYKEPDGNTSKLIEHPLLNQEVKTTSDNFRWSASVAAFGFLLRDSEFKGSTNIEEVIKWAKSAKGKDENGYRAEFIRLAESYQLMAL